MTTIEDLVNEIKLYEHFIVQGNERINVGRTIPDEYREMIRLGRNRGWLKHFVRYHTAHTYSAGYELSHSGKAWFKKRKDESERSREGDGPS